jgi:hypothetical protein
MRVISVEKIIENLNVHVYPITIVKFLLNKRRILSYFEKAASNDFEIRGVKYKLDNSDCVICNEKKNEEVSCRQHTSINRVLESDNVMFDLDTNTYFYKNEIFRIVGDKVVIVYCPHPKLITSPITDIKVRKINPITVEDPELLKKMSESKLNKVSDFISSKFLDQYMKCWFNDEFSIVTIPEDRNFSNFCLVPNR